jgi:hypothetical protein
MSSDFGAAHIAFVSPDSYASIVPASGIQPGSSM